MTSRAPGTTFSRKNYRLSTEPEKSKVAGRNTVVDDWEKRRLFLQILIHLVGKGLT
uniref:Uncharacterized protein n=1 Tax=Podarcis muralis TaxID=64176 RepID=A0A670HXH1_PODMU